MQLSRNNNADQNIQEYQNRIGMEDSHSAAAIGVTSTLNSRKNTPIGRLDLIRIHFRMQRSYCVIDDNLSYQQRVQEERDLWNLNEIKNYFKTTNVVVAEL